MLTPGTPRQHSAAILAGAGFIAVSAVLVRLSGASPGAAAFFRCALALPVLGALTLVDRRRPGRRAMAARTRWLARFAGVAFAIDLVLWGHTIADVGAGLATVLGNVQVIFVAFAAWTVMGERLERSLLYALPVMLLGVLLIGGVMGSGSYGIAPAQGTVFGVGTSLFYAVYLLVLRFGLKAESGQKSLQGEIGVIAPLFQATLGAAVGAGLLAAVLGDFRLGGIALVSLGWLALLAVSSQVIGWLLISRSLPVLPAALTSTLLLVQPAGAVALGFAVFDERPSAAQLSGVALLLAGVLFAAVRSGRSAPVQGKSA